MLLHIFIIIIINITIITIISHNYSFLMKMKDMMIVAFFIYDHCFVNIVVNINVDFVVDFVVDAAESMTEVADVVERMIEGIADDGIADDDYLIMMIVVD